MALKRRSKIEASFSMASMTDVIFLLLIFFMVTSTLVIPNAIKVMLPQSAQQTSANPITRVTIDKKLRYYVAQGSESDREVAFEELTPFLLSARDASPEMYVALYADEDVPYKEVIKVLNIATVNKFKMVLATRPTK